MNKEGLIKIDGEYYNENGSWSDENRIWVLSIRTSLPEVCETANDLKLTVIAYDSFEKGRAAMRDAIKSFAFSRNSMFDGEGGLIQMQKYSDETGDYEEDFVLTPDVISSIQNTLKQAFAGNDTAFELECGIYTDWMAAASIEKDSIRMYGDDDGPDNGINPVLSTNILSMEKKQDYYLYIDDRFGQDDASSELYIDLKQTAVE